MKRRKHEEESIYEEEYEEEEIYVMKLARVLFSCFDGFSIEPQCDRSMARKCALR